jgi:hypothetical protein
VLSAGAAWRILPGLGAVVNSSPPAPAQLRDDHRGPPRQPASPPAIRNGIPPPATAELVLAGIEGRPAAIDDAPFRPARFTGKIEVPLPA